MRTWERNPQYYGDLLSTSLAGQVLFDYAPLPERARRVLSKLHQVPRLMQAARDNIKDPPGIFIKVGLESLRGTLRFIEDGSAARASAASHDMHVLGDLADASTEAAQAIGVLRRATWRTTWRRARAGPFRLGRDVLQQKLRLDEGITLDADRLLAIAEPRAARRRRRSSAASRRGSTRSRRIPRPRGRAPRTSTRRRARSSPRRRSSSRS